MSLEGKGLTSLPPKWGAFLRELDAALGAPVEIHCIGGFVLTAYYGAPRATKDLDYIAAISPTVDLEAIAGEGSKLAKKHSVYIHRVGIATYPEDYETRLVQIFPGEFIQLRLMALDPYDLILTKMDRNGDIDRADAKFLAQKLKLNAEILRERYDREFRPNFVGDSKRLDLTFKLWVEAYFAQ